ncbi:uncharacterized protein GGS22DRAFT_88365 [Annulohypoxylon maeteangense]|uniref:uncharacterized protein n=1 Tax=Annulohypoxylon maeteangense TaxID=1927788 RepID=UPI0020081020|nr:uncharacterized protein GGS22DRAFT_88365 [Annulohypoxylon maeteangense]KAI0887721.1 hypothetical protein GGS22DRAFT_88365 [Annulohypoxylon maeteangense]
MTSPLGENRQKTNIPSTVMPSTRQGKENYRDDAADMTKSNAVSSRKRKSDVFEDNQSMPEIDDDDPRLRCIDDTCNQIRRKVKSFIEGGNMKVYEFQRAINVTSSTYQRFMRQNGMYKGSESAMYSRAFAFFKKRELKGLKASPPKKARKSDEKNVLDVDDIEMDGQNTQEVPVYDTCDEIRKKIRAFLRKPDISQAAFCQAISRSFPEEGRKVQSRQLNAFLSKKGAMMGNTSPVFYGAYVFLEKQRIKDGKPKSEMRDEMEKIHPDGVNTSDPETRWICRGNERPVHDKYGRIRFI